MEWQGIGETLGETLGRKPAKGERMLAAGGSELMALDAMGTFTASSLHIDPQPIELRIFVEDYLPGREWQGRVDYVYPSLDEKTRTLRIRLRFANADRVLKPNMFALVVIHTEPVAHALVVPREAVIRTGRQERVVLALGEGRFTSQILGGLAEHDKVVVSAQFLLDSEASKSADLKRMESADPATASPDGDTGVGQRRRWAPPCFSAC